MQRLKPLKGVAPFGLLTVALHMKTAAGQHAFEDMVGCMVGTSLAMAPAFFLAPGARYVGLDGP